MFATISCTTSKLSSYFFFHNNWMKKALQTFFVAIKVLKILMVCYKYTAL